MLYKVKMEKCKLTKFSELSRRPPGGIFSKFLSLFFKIGDNAAVI
jgi:hypothetical protein